MNYSGDVNKWKSTSAKSEEQDRREGTSHNPFFEGFVFFNFTL